MSRQGALANCCLIAAWLGAPLASWAQDQQGIILVKGQVTDSVGSGLAGVRVSLNAKNTTDTPSETISETVTDELGDFALRGKQRLTGTFLVNINKDQFAPFVRELELKSDSAPPFVGETLEGSLSLVGRVVDGRHEQAVSHASVEVSASYRDWHVETDDEGRFKLNGLPPGSAQITIDATGFARQSLAVKSIADAGELQVSLKTQRIVRVKIIDESGNALAAAQIELLDPAQNDMRVAVGDDQGKAAFAGISADTVMVLAKVSHPGFLSAQSFDRSLQLPKDVVESEHSLIMERAASVAGVVRDADQKPIAGARIMTGKDYSLRSARAWTDSEGNFMIEGLAAGPAVLTVHRSDFAPELKIVDVKRGEINNFDFSLRPGRTIKGVVKDERDTPMEGMEVVATNWRGYMTLGLRALTNDAGRFELRDAPTDEFSVSAHAPPTSPVNQLVPQGEAEINIRVPYVPEFDKNPKGVHIAVGDAAPPVELRTTDNDRLQVDQLKGKTVLYVFWTSWCPSCNSEVPNLIKLYERYEKRADFLMIGINRDQDAKGFEKFMEKHKLPWKQVHGHANGALLLAKEFGAFEYPTGYIVGPDSKMAGVYLIGTQMDDKLYDLLLRPQRVRIEPTRPNNQLDKP